IAIKRELLRLVLSVAADMSAARGICCHTSTASPETAYGTLLWVLQDTSHGMAMRRGKKRPMSTIPCLILAAASCFARLSESLQVTVQPASIVQKFGGPVSLGCVVDPPRVNLTWRLNGKELAGSDEVLGINIERGKLVITALNNHTVGRYQCIARVPEGVIASVPAVVTLA
ncbi:PREDICTED: brother of CDO-like, partial [Leptosomus discolor]|uniref:brother of CDO-like n=1 Tax=Leptosomus discolor TaxID=188344 RepID=UPI000522C872